MHLMVVLSAMKWSTTMEMKLFIVKAISQTVISQTITLTIAVVQLATMEYILEAALTNVISQKTLLMMLEALSVIMLLEMLVTEY